MSKCCPPQCVRYSDKVAIINGCSHGNGNPWKRSSTVKTTIQNFDYYSRNVDRKGNCVLSNTTLEHKVVQNILLVIFVEETNKALSEYTDQNATACHTYLLQYGHSLLGWFSGYYNLHNSHKYVGSKLAF